MFNDVKGGAEKVPSNATADITKSNFSHSVSGKSDLLDAPLHYSGENKMADIITDPAMYANQVQLAADIRGAEANIRDKVGAEACLINKNVGDVGQRIEKGLGDNRYTIANEAGALSKQIGAEACGINKHIGDTRQEDSENFGHTRRDIQSTASEIRYDVATSSGEIRREGAEHTNEIIKEGIKGDYGTRGDIKDARFDLNTRITSAADRVVDRVEDTKDSLDDRFFTVGRDLADLRQGQATLAKDVELQALKTQLDAKANTQYLNDKIVMDGEKTRALINDLKYHDLNRGLVERNTELVNCEQDRRLYRDRWDDVRFAQLQTGFQGQWAQLQSQIQAFQSQLQETRQGMVNFGTMAGNAGQQSSTSNNVR